LSNPYKILGVVEADTLTFIKRRYRQLAMKNHPDKGGNPDKFKEIKEAYETIVKEKSEIPAKVSFDNSADAFFRKMFGNRLGPWR